MKELYQQSPYKSRFFLTCIYIRDTIELSKEIIVMNALSLPEQTQVISCVVEGNSIPSTERMTGFHRDTIMRLMVRVGNGCEALQSIVMHDLPCKRIQVDELWAFVGMKQRHMKADDDLLRTGDTWTWVAIDADTKLVPCYHVGMRTLTDAYVFMGNLSHRLANRVQLSSGALNAYAVAVDRYFGLGVDSGQVVKSYEAEPTGPGRYSPPKVVAAPRGIITGEPDPAYISTSCIERQNLTIRMSQRRFTRLTNGFSKKWENLRAAVGLHYGYYNFVRVHQTVKTTPAIAAGLTNVRWSVSDLIEATGVV
jgi:IS1 family transposase